ncbi:MAG: hypothetical protein J0I06_07240 [Planctomycetes bacterium]|nr:hypothetical protein [Planctomycetota bacterium]
MLRVAITGLFGGVLAVLFVADGRASLHHPDSVVSAMISVDDAGAPEPYPFEEFKRRRLVLRNIGNPDWKLEAEDPVTKAKIIDPKTGKPQLTERGIVAARIKLAQGKRADRRTVDENVTLAIDLLRFGRADEAEGVLKGQRSGFLPNITLAHIAATQGQWARAFDYLDIANEERVPPAINPKSPKIAWQLKANRGPLLKLVKLRLAETHGPKLQPENELPDQLWPVNFVNDAGVYEPGKLAAAEKAKLPGGDFPEAIATVQQLVLWFPYDVRLYWLLGELYAAQGDVKAAQEVMDECVNSGRYSNRKMLMTHREAVMKAASVEPAPPPEPPSPVPFTISAIWWYFGAVGALALFALVRAVLKKGKSAG